MAKIITNASQLTAAWLSETLLRGGGPRQGSVTEISLETFASFFADFYRIAVTYSLDARPAPVSRMILKVPFAAHEQALEMGRAEVLAYRKFQTEMPGAPVPRCFDTGIDEETGRSHLLLEDLSPTHFCGNVKEEISPRHWERCVESLADLHAFWWESEALGTIGAPLLTGAE